MARTKTSKTVNKGVESLLVKGVPIIPAQEKKEVPKLSKELEFYWNNRKEAFDLINSKVYILVGIRIVPGMEHGKHKIIQLKLAE